VIVTKLLSIFSQKVLALKIHDSSFLARFFFLNRGIPNRSMFVMYAGRYAMQLFLKQQFAGAKTDGSIAPINLVILSQKGKISGPCNQTQIILTQK